MARNTNLHAAKTAKNDEFYTQYSDIEKEVSNYKEHFKGKWVLCPCDARWSNFYKFFQDHFMEYGLARLTATNYDNGDGAWRVDYFGGGAENVQRLKGNGDFRSKEVTDIMKQADIVVTNPPFSLFRDFVAWLNGKEFSL